MATGDLSEGYNLLNGFTLLNTFLASQWAAYTSVEV